MQRGPGPWGDAHLASDGHTQSSPGEVQAMLIHPSLTPGRSLLPRDIPASNSTFLFPSRPLLTGQNNHSKAGSHYTPPLTKRDGEIPPSWLERYPALGQRLPWPNHCSSVYTPCLHCHPSIQSFETAFQGPTLKTDGKSE